MTPKSNQWNKTELKIYILLLCANADSSITDDEMSLIKTKTDASTLDKIYKEFKNDTEDESFAKIEDSINAHHFSHKELSEFKKEMLEVFYADKKFVMMEHTLDKIMDNMLY
jgi:hypothetical protein